MKKKTDTHLIYIDENLNSDALRKIQPRLEKYQVNFIALCRYPLTAERFHELTGIECFLLEDFFEKDGKRSGYRLAREYIEDIFNTEYHDGITVREACSQQGFDIANCIAYALQSKFYNLFYEYQGWKQILGDFEPVQVYYVGGKSTLVIIRSLVHAKHITILSSFESHHWDSALQNAQKLFRNVKSVFTQWKHKILIKNHGTKQTRTKTDIVFFSFADNYIEPLLPIIKDCEDYKLSYDIVDVTHSSGRRVLDREEIPYVDFSVFWRFRFLGLKILYIFSIWFFLVYRLRPMLQKDLEYHGLEKMLYLYFKEILIFNGAFAIEMAYMTMQMCETKEPKIIVVASDYWPYVRGIIEGTKRRKSETIVICQWGDSGIEEGIPSTTDYIITNSAFNRDIFIKRGYASSSILISSNCFLEKFRKLENSTSSDHLGLLKKYHIDPSKKIVFFPTQPYSEGMYATDIYRSLDIAYKTFSMMKNIELVIKLHYKEEDFALYEYLEETYSYRPKIFHNDCDISELLQLADIVMVICTLVGWQSLLAGEKLIQYREPNARYGSGLNYYDFGAALTYSSESELFSAVSRLLGDDDIQKELSLGRSRYLAKYFSDNNHDTKKNEIDIIKGLLAV